MLDRAEESKEYEYHSSGCGPHQPLFFLPRLFSWDDSSSVSSGLSDTLDNISTDDLNTPVYSAGGSSRKSKGGGGAQVRMQEARN